MRVEVAYAKPEAQVVVPLEVAEGTTAAGAIEASGLLDKFPEIELADNRVGVFSKPCPLNHVLRAGDRVEIYRALIADPKEARRNRAARK